VLLSEATVEGMDPEQKRKQGDYDPPLPRDAAERLVPLFDRLTNADLLERCMTLSISKANESLHSVVWKRTSKAVFNSGRQWSLQLPWALCNLISGLKHLST